MTKPLDTGADKAHNQHMPATATANTEGTAAMNTTDQPAAYPEFLWAVAAQYGHGARSRGEALKDAIRWANAGGMTMPDARACAQYARLNLGTLPTK